MNIFHDIEIAKGKTIKVIKPNVKAVGPVIFNEVKQLHVFRIDELYLAYKTQKEADRVRQDLLIDIKEYFTKLIGNDVVLYEQVTDIQVSSGKKNKKKYKRKRVKPINAADIKIDCTSESIPPSHSIGDNLKDESIQNTSCTTEDVSDEKIAEDAKAVIDSEDDKDIDIDNTEYKTYMKGYNKCYNCDGDKFKKENPFQEGTKLHFNWDKGWNGRMKRLEARQKDNDNTDAV